MTHQAIPPQKPPTEAPAPEAGAPAPRRLYRNPFQRLRARLHSGFRWSTWEHWWHVARVPVVLARDWWRGYSMLEVWNINTYLAEWLGTRLVLMSESACGAPCGYPNPVAAWDIETDETDFDAWKRDLQKHGEALLEWHECEDWSEPWWMEEGRTMQEIMARENAARDPAREAMRWTAEWWESFWD